MIDLRSDTVTKPSAAMRAAMAAAEVGDDVYGEDPTVNLLEERAARMFGKEAALFLPTGTMANTIAIKLHTRHGEEVACDSRSHIIDWELSMMAWFAGCIPRAISTVDGIMRWRQIASVLRKGGQHSAPTTLVSLENTHNIAGGTVYPLSDLDEICHEVHGLKLAVHMDGARVFNAAAALNVPVSRIVRDCDSVMFCVSKGLGAPMGSLLISSAEKIAEGRLYRKRLGGGMRQAGVVAAAGLVALEESPPLLLQDHQNARDLAARLSQIPGLKIDPSSVVTNIVVFDIASLGVSTRDFSAALKRNGVLSNGIAVNVMRMVTHRDVSAEECGRAAEVVAAVTEQFACQNSKDALHPVL